MSSQRDYYHTIVCFQDDKYYVVHDQVLNYSPLKYSRTYTPIGTHKLINTDLKIYKMHGNSPSYSYVIVYSEYIGKESIKRRAISSFYMIDNREYRMPYLTTGRGFCSLCRDKILHSDFEYYPSQRPVFNPYYKRNSQHSQDNVIMDNPNPERNSQHSQDAIIMDNPNYGRHVASGTSQYSTEYGDQFGYNRDNIQNRGQHRNYDEGRDTTNTRRVNHNPVARERQHRYYDEGIETTNTRRVGYNPNYGRTSRNRSRHHGRTDTITFDDYADDETLQRVINESFDTPQTIRRNIDRRIKVNNSKHKYINSPRFGIVRKDLYPNEPDLNEYKPEQKTVRPHIPIPTNDNKTLEKRIEELIKDTNDYKIKCSINYKFNGALFQYNIDVVDEEIRGDDIYKCIICQDNIIRVIIGEKENGKYKIVSPCDCSGSGGLMHRTCYNECIKNAYVQCTICRINYHIPEHIDKETKKSLKKDYKIYDGDNVNPNIRHNLDNYPNHVRTTLV
jgi:hypothetical protein